MTDRPEPNQPVDFQALARLVESNAKAIEAAGNQQQIDREQARLDRELSRADREQSRQSREETREDIRALTALMRESRERSEIQEREIRMQSGEIQNLADSIQVLYSRQPPQPSS
jgi:peptide subunit release factor 1 (eRF1)